MNALNLQRMIRGAALPLAAAAALLCAPGHSRATDNSSAQATTARGTADAAKAGQQADRPYRAMRASELLGQEVRNPQGQHIGEIRDLVVNVDSGAVRYAMLAFDPGILQGERLFAVPTTELRMGDGNAIVYRMTRERLERAGVPDADWRGAAWRDTLSQAHRAWSTGGVVQPSDSARAYRVSDLLGKDVNSRSGEDIGELEELVINMATQKAHYAVLAFDPSWATPETNYAFPLTAFQLGRDADELMLDIDRSQVKAMKGFDDDRYGRLNDRRWVMDVDHYLVTVVPNERTGGGTDGSRTDTPRTDAKGGES